jgi:hypothetical protein
VGHQAAACQDDMECLEDITCMDPVVVPAQVKRQQKNSRDVWHHKDIAVICQGSQRGGSLACSITSGICTKTGSAQQVPAVQDDQPPG